MKNVNVLALEIIKNSTEVIERAKDLKKGFSFGKLMALGKGVSVEVEKYTQEVGELSSNSKISLGIELLVNLVDVPYVPQWIERKIYKIVLKKVIKLFNKKFGSNWLQNIPGNPIEKNDVNKICTGVKKKIKKEAQSIADDLMDEVIKKVKKADLKNMAKEVLNEKISKNRSNLRKRTR